jgi:hypothetical protein
MKRGGLDSLAGTPASQAPARCDRATPNAIARAGVPATPPRGATIRLPRTSGRDRSRTFAKLLARVDPEAQCGTGFEGTIMRPGTMVPREKLWPTPAHPKIPIMLECAGPSNPQTGHRSRKAVYILWRFDPLVDTWSEIARSTSESWTWATDLRPIAIRLLEESRGNDVAVYVSLEQAIARACAALDQELKQLGPQDRVRFAGAMHDEVAMRRSGHIEFVLGTITSADPDGDLVELARRTACNP